MRVLCFFIVLFLISCANQGSLIGGDKDENPPSLEGAYPPMGSVNFDQNGFILEFDENIQVKNLNQNLLVSPFLETKPKVKVKPRSIEIELQDELLPNTTYTFNFGNAIQDLNEGNELSGFTYVFSTGVLIDQSSFEGKMVDAATGKVPEDGVWVLLYDSDVDSLFQTTPPRYATPVKEDGTYQFQNLKNGQYQIFALSDKNSNYYYDLPNEQIAFVDRLVSVNDSTIFEQTLELFEPLPESGFVRNATSDQPNSLVLETSANTERFLIKFYPEIKPKFTKAYKDSIRYWFDNDFPDSLSVSVDNQLVDTLSVLNFEEEIQDTTFKIRLKGYDDYSSNFSLELTSKNPFDFSGSERPILLEDSLFVAGGVELIPDSLDATLFEVKHNFLYGKEYILQFEDSLFTDFYGLPSDSLGVSFTVPEKEKLSVLSIDLVSENVPNTPLIFHLNKGKDVYLTRYLRNINDEIIISDLPPGRFTVTLIIDENGNQKWDTGDYTSKQQPEKVLVYDTEIETRANWDVDVQINLDE